MDVTGPLLYVNGTDSSYENVSQVTEKKNKIK
jgi:hypothetical protein